MDDLVVRKVIHLFLCVCFRALKFCLISLSVGLLAAVLSLTKTGLYLEEEWGLAWFFNIRGPLQSKGADRVAIVSIDKMSADRLQLPEDPEKWSRTLYAELIDNINRHRPALIAFNLYFGEQREPSQDEALAKAMRDHGNVVLSSYLKQFVSTGSQSQYLRYEHINNPIPSLADEALAIAPFPLPKTATTVKQFWAFRRNAGDTPTFPTVVFLSYLLNQAYFPLLETLKQVDPAYACQAQAGARTATKNGTTFGTFSR